MVLVREELTPGVSFKKDTANAYRTFGSSDIAFCFLAIVHLCPPLSLLCLFFWGAYTVVPQSLFIFNCIFDTHHIHKQALAFMGTAGGVGAILYHIRSVQLYWMIPLCLILAGLSMGVSFFEAEVNGCQHILRLA